MRSMLLGCVLVVAGCQAPVGDDWQGTLQRRLPRLGHRNFVVVADAAYPEQSHPSIETIWTGQDLPTTLARVLAMVDAAPHVAARVWLDAELDAVPEALAPGIDEHRARLAEVLAGRPVERAEHVAIIKRLDETAQLFSVVVLKTDMRLPYTSVFVELDCGYWDAASERALRQSLGR